MFGIAVAGFAIVSSEEEERVPTASDLSHGELIAAANAVRQQLLNADQVARTGRQSMSRAAVMQRAEQRLEDRRERYWQILEARPPGIDEDLLAVIERIPRPTAETVAEELP